MSDLTQQIIEREKRDRTVYRTSAHRPIQWHALAA